MRSHRLKSIFALMMATTAALGASNPDGEPPATSASTLFETMSALDTAVFESFNQCSAPDQLQAHARYFAEDVEFYHDTGGVTWSRDAMIANTRQYVCGNFRRELVPGTLQVHPIKDFGAMTQGSHRFCAFSTDTCDGRADFVMVWRQLDNDWQITRVLSYGHRPN